jgi:dolichol kinase
MMLFITYTAYQVEHQSYPSLNTHYNARSALSSGVLLGALSLPWLCSMTTMNIKSTHMYNAIALASIMQIAVIIKFQHRTDRLKWHVGTIAVTLFWSVILLQLLTMPMHATSSSVHAFIILPLMVVVVSCSIVLAILHYLPRTFTIGEAMVVAQGLAVLISHWNTNTITNTEPSPLMVILGSTLSSIMVLTVRHTIMGNNRVDNNRRPSLALPPPSAPPAPISSRILLLSLTIFISASFALSSSLQYLSFIILSRRRILIMIYWAAMLVFNLPIMYLLAHGTGGGSDTTHNRSAPPPPPPPHPSPPSTTIPNIVLRKGYHILACTLFLPPILLKEVDMLGMGLAVALSVLMLVEVVRVTEVPVIGPVVHKFMASFIDERDKGVVFTTHLTLLVGMAVPIWITSYNNNTNTTTTNNNNNMFEREVLVSGIAIIGIGDAVASVVGSLLGRVSICRGSRKTVEGTVAGAGATWVCMRLLLLQGDGGESGGGAMVRWGVATFLSSLLEASTSQLDNLFIPLHFYTVLCCLLQW